VGATRKALCVQLRIFGKKPHPPAFYRNPFFPWGGERNGARKTEGAWPKVVQPDQTQPRPGRANGINRAWAVTLPASWCPTP